MSGVNINVSEGKNVPAQTIMTGRGCIIGQSGSGKSYLAGVIAEELCRLKLPFCIIDPEGEYFPLRNAFQLIIAGGAKGDVGLDVDFHALFKSSIQNSLPVIIDMSEIDRKDDVLNSVLSELYLVEEELTTPYPVIVEEADKFIPQKGRANKMLEEIAVRGRKKGIGLMIISQRPANIDKNVLSQCSYGFIGKLVIENDIGAVSIFFQRQELKDIAGHNPGEFSSFGLGFTGTVHMKPMVTPHGGATPRLQRQPAGEKLANVINELKTKTITATAISGEKKKVIDVLSLPQNVNEDDIREYATSREKKEFLLFGKTVESIDSINRKFISVVLVGIRLPSGRKGEYTERYLMLDDRLRFVVFDGKLRFYEGPLAGESKLLNEDYDVLSLLADGRGKKPNEIGEELGMGQRAALNSLKRLKLRKLVVYKGNKSFLRDYGSNLMSERPRTVPVSADASLIINRRVDERIEKEWTRAIFPSSVLFDCERVLIPVYEIKFRHGDRIRMILVDAVVGRVIN